MPTFDLGPADALYYEHAPPASESGWTFVCFNALTGDVGHWLGAVAPRLVARGHGHLVFNYRGQNRSPYAPGTALDADLIAGDAARLIAALAPVRPVLAGLSIGGLFAARAWLAGTAADALVLINTLRRDGPRLRWLNDALARCAEVGGLELLRDLYSPLLCNDEWQAAHRNEFLTDAPYAAIDRAAGPYNLLSHGASADWDLPYERLDPPVLVVTGLQDHMFLEPDAVAELFARLPHGRRVDFANAGHLIPVERPEALADSMAAFVEDL